MNYFHWAYSIFLIFLLIQTVNYSEVEEISNEDKSPKFNLIFNGKTYLLGTLFVIYLLLCIFI
ncbi:hypothetical protein EA58_14155 [Photobacterium galatheae]|uniref:Uncharacterized protein n=1 Tax=Photobacterium galatheae TaxID=1654360 RepID=A0A066RU31_9GAMM|nr:hypothetical protein EA58_14155 [Photobacterium galatheae]